MEDRKIVIHYEEGQMAATPDHRERSVESYDKFVMGAAPIVIDWEKGYDVRNKLGGDFKFKNQGPSLSCVGQGSSIYVWVKQVVEMMSKYNLKLPELRQKYPQEVDEVSAKAIYSQIFLSPQGGAYIRDALELIVNWGSVFESTVPSINPATGLEDENWMRDRSWLNKQMTDLAKILKGKEARIIDAADNMDLFAQAIILNDGVVGGVLGQNGQGWSTENPQPPIDMSKVWGHCVYYGAFGTDELGRFIATPNSWGNGFRKDPTYVWKPGDKPGQGWQKIRPNYFNNTIQFDPHTYVDLPNSNKDMIFKKEIGKPNIYACNETTKVKCLVTDPETLQLMYELTGQNGFVEVETLADYKPCSLKAILGVEREIN